MKRFVKRLRSEQQGMTLIELIATVAVFSMVMMAIYGVIHFGFGAYHRITIENSLRDEGDLLMSSVITELYSFGPDSVSQQSNGLTLNKMERKESGEVEVRPSSILLDNGVMSIDGHDVDIRSQLLNTSKIAVVCTSNDTASCTSGSIEIELELSQSYGGKEQRLKLQSRFGF